MEGIPSRLLGMRRSFQGQQKVLITSASPAPRPLLSRGWLQKQKIEEKAGLSIL